LEELDVSIYRREEINSSLKMEAGVSSETQNINISSLTRGSKTRDGFVSPLPMFVSHALSAVLTTMYIATGSNAKEHLTPRVNHESRSLGLQDPHF
jgi:hypothetical protein